VDRQPRVGVLADDLIWASRLAAAAEQAGAEVVRLTGRDALVEALDGPFRPVALLVDLAGRRFDPLDGIWVAAQAGLAVLAVGQHEDLDLRHRALEAGASAWISYNAFFRRGAVRVGALLAGERAPEARESPASPTRP
jgi:DNA-binding response OmpR family regulator